jgi:hypothetical protein
MVQGSAQQLVGQLEMSTAEFGQTLNEEQLIG